MNEYTFSAYGHPNILATHKNTLEFTTEAHLSVQGDCIIGVQANYEISELKKCISQKKNEINRNTHQPQPVTVKILAKTPAHEFVEQFTCVLNPDFSDEIELVIRKSNAATSRTLGIYSQKAAHDISRGMIAALQNPSQKIEVTIKF